MRTKRAHLSIQFAFTSSFCASVGFHDLASTTIPAARGCLKGLRATIPTVPTEIRVSKNNFKPLHYRRLTYRRKKWPTCCILDHQTIRHFFLDPTPLTDTCGPARTGRPQLEYPLPLDNQPCGAKPSRSATRKSCPDSLLPLPSGFLF